MEEEQVQAERNSKKKPKSIEWSLCYKIEVSDDYGQEDLDYFIELQEQIKQNISIQDEQKRKT